MTAQRHAIQRLVVEAAASDAAEAQRISATISAAFPSFLAPLIDRHLSAFGNPRRVERIDRLEVDLGRIDPARLPAMLTAGLERQLPLALARARRIAGGAPDRAADGEPHESALLLIGHFARTGSLPWWSEARQTPALDEALATALAAAPQALASLVRSLGGDPRAIERLVLTLSDAALRSLLALLSPKAADLPIELGPRLAALPALVGFSRFRLRALMWRETLAAAIAGADAPTGALTRLAAVAGTTLELLASDLRTAARPPTRIGDAPRTTRTGPEPIAPDHAVDLIADRGEVDRLPFATEGAKAIEGEPAPHDDADAMASNWLAELDAITSLEATAIEGEAVARRDADATASNWLTELDAITSLEATAIEGEAAARRDADATASTLGHGERAARAAAEFDAQANEAAALGDVDAVRSATAPGVGAAHSAILALLDRLAALRPALEGLIDGLRPLAARLPEADRIACAAALEALARLDPAAPQERFWAAVAALVRPFVRTGLATLADLRPAMAALPPRPEPAPMRPRRPGAPADLDALYVENAGLCLLWPFLPRALARLDLLNAEGTGFVAEAARHRAVGLMHHVATAERQAPEVWLALNKVLCGFDTDDLVRFGPEVTEAEAAECAAMLSAAIAHAACFGEMSIHGLRGAFLLRRGALSVRDGAWLLRVERQPVDVVLDRLPWRIEWIRFPWMKAPMRVEW